MAANPGGRTTFWPQKLLKLKIVVQADRYEHKKV